MRPHHGGTAYEAAETQTQPPNQVWLDAIMSQTRVVEPAQLPPQSADHTDGAAGSWPQQPQAEADTLDVDQDPLGLLHQLRVDDDTLLDAMSDALQELVGEQDCCFIARGLCHLCGTSKQSPVPVVNFCPTFRADHSLCRDHLRSLHRVRMDDLFAGKNRPTVSKRCLKCTICFRSCVCAICQAERRQDLAKYRAWIGAELERTCTGQALPPPSAENKQPTTETVERIEAPQALPAPTEDQDMDETEDEDAQPKAASRHQHPKRAAKALPQDPHSHGSTLMNGSGGASELPTEVQELEVVQGEQTQSLVQLLSTLHQESERQSGSSESTDSSAASSSQGRRRRSITKATPVPSSTTETDTSNEARGAANAAEQIEAKPTEVRHQKRKRDSFMADKRSSESSRSSATETSFRKKAPAALDLEAPASQGRASGRGKHSKTPRRDPVTKPSPPSVISTRKRRGPKPKPKVTERKKYRRDSTRASSSRQQQRQTLESDEGDESELDTNLDYCEVCLGAGDLVCCDKCPRSFHLACLKMQESDLPEGDWQCAECKKPSYFEGFTVKVASETTVAGKCLAIVRCLKSHPFSKPFLTPVENVPHYTSLVEKPMDLSTIERKLQKQQYAKQVHVAGVRDAPESDAHQIAMLAAFAHDVRLVWSNCKFFNDDGSGITRAADELANGFNGLYNDVIQFIKLPPVPAPAKKGASPAAVPQPADTEAKASSPKPSAAPAPALTVASQPVENSSQVETKGTTPSVSESKPTPAASPASATNDAVASTTEAAPAAEEAPVTETAAAPVAPEPVAAPSPEKPAEAKEG